MLSEPTDLRVAKFECDSDHILIFKTDVALTKEQTEYLREAVAKQLKPLGVKHLLVTYGIEVTKLHEKDVPLEWQSALEKCE